MEFDKKIIELSKTIYQTSVINHGSKIDPKFQINKIKNMIREFIRAEVVPYELTKNEKLNFILDNEYKITLAVFNGHKATDQDEFSEIRSKIKQFRKELGLI